MRGDSAAPFHVIALPGEGVGLEVVPAACEVLRAVASRFGPAVEISTHEVGEAAFQRTGKHLPDDVRSELERLRGTKRAAILFGSVADEPIGILRKDFDLFGNLRPITFWPQLAENSPLRPERAAELNLLIVRELVSDVYYGPTSSGTDARGRWACQGMYYSEGEVERIARVGFSAARGRRKRLAVIHKGNVVKEVFAIWLDVARRVAREYPDVELSDVLVDNMAMQMVLSPARYDVLLCSNLFGDILSDLGAGLVGSIGMMPSASLSADGFGLYESIGGTAPDLAGTDTANPIATILSVAMMYRHSMGHEEGALAIEAAVRSVLSRARTPDIAQRGCETVGLQKMAALIAEAIRIS